MSLIISHVMNAVITAFKQNLVDKVYSVSCFCPISVFLPTLALQIPPLPELSEVAIKTYLSDKTQNPTKIHQKRFS